jgi:hypothetical protein
MRIIAVAVWLVCLLTLACRLGQPKGWPIALAGPDEAVHLKVWVAVWSVQSIAVARLMIGRYGQPEEVHSDRMVWLDRWPWKRIVVSAEASQTPLEQVVDYRVPEGKLRDLQRFSPNLRVDAEQRELSSSSDREDYNRLALNLADDVVGGRLTPAQAKRFFEQTVRLSSAGKSSPYTKRLFFVTLPEEADPARLERF